MIRSRRYAQIVALADALGTHFDLGLRAYDAGDLHGVQRHRAAVGMLPEGGPQSLEYLALRWRELWVLDQREAALEVARDANQRYPDDLDTALDLGDVLTDLGRGEEALEALTALVKRNPDDPDLWYEVGLAAERLERWETRLAAFKRVWDLEHAAEPGDRLWVSDERFTELAEGALERLPEGARRALGNVAVMVEDYPEAWIFETDVADPRVLGLFDGVERSVERGSDFVSRGPSLIHLFRWNIERFCHDEEEVEEQVEITVLHEVGHYLGLDEEDLRHRGLD
jgi:predicted Zn-dependent protease with MMP-like domain